MTASIEYLIDFAFNEADRFIENAQAERDSAIFVSYMLLAVAIVIAVLLAYFITRGVVGPLMQALDLAQMIAKGDLSKVIKTSSKDETGQLLEAMGSMQSKLSDVIEKDVQGIVDSARRRFVETYRLTG